MVCCSFVTADVVVDDDDDDDDDDVPGWPFSLLLELRDDDDDDTTKGASRIQNFSNRALPCLTRLVSRSSDDRSDWCKS